uniref:Granulin b n=1 Tax=Hippocampus comes TaxID=109280 RepID=A0A3Q2Y9Y1_HIPCM
AQALVWWSLLASGLLGTSMSLVCPDGGTCQEGSTCCTDVAGRYGCCPLPRVSPHTPARLCTPNLGARAAPQDICCSNGIHCCPEGTAVCCHDGFHCCPHGKRCNLEAKTCDDASGTTAVATGVTACDEHTSCPKGASCCFMKSAGKWGCCPLPQVTLHATTSYRAGSPHMPPDTRHCLTFHVCKYTNMPNCPLCPTLHKTSPITPSNMFESDRKCAWCPQAVCCQDGSHCCPAGHTCDPHRSSCSRGRRVVPWLTKTPAVARPPAVADVKCDDKSSCAAGTTCCKLPTGEWGCCPLVKAVCCPDREHCCPQGYSCNMETGTCEKPAAAPDVAAAAVRVETMVPCDVAAAFACAERETCCRSSASEWACCPSPQAVCCADMKHCCPAHYSCHPSGGCVRTAPTWAASLRDPDIRKLLLEVC